MMTADLVFAPLLGWGAVWAALALTALLTVLSRFARQSGWMLRALAGLLLSAALANPALQSRAEEKLSDIVLIVSDDSASQALATRPEQTQAALAHLQERLKAFPTVEPRFVSVPQDPKAGTALMAALTQALAELPANRLAGIFVVTDGQIHDLEATPEFEAPLHVILSGTKDDWDRRLILRNAPAYAILGEPFVLRLHIEDQGRAPQESVPLSISIDGATPLKFTVPTGRDIELPLTLEHGGANVIHFVTPGAQGELTTRNNEAVVQINGLRDRMQVLLVSGEPHAGERTWRNLLKSDPSVDLVHFTILRPADKSDETPAEDLALIAFPTRELFSERIEDFDLIIFDRFTRLSLVSNEYLQNVVRFVQNGGALLLSTGPEFAQADSVYRTPLAQILPARPTAEVIEQAFRPQVTALGEGHPVTHGLARLDAAGAPLWGEWLRLTATQAVPEADVLLTGPDDLPLLLLNRLGEGRVAMLTSDQSWLWARGYDGGGPHLELLRRLSHWLMREPDLEEEALWADPLPEGLRLVRRSLQESVPPIRLTLPDGSVQNLTLSPTTPGRFEALFETNQLGLYRLSDGVFSRVVVLGPATPREFEATLATPDLLDLPVKAHGGGIFRSEDALPDLRLARSDTLWGSTWAGITPRGAVQLLELQQRALLPLWLWLVLAGGAMIWAWLREGRR